MAPNYDEQEPDLDEEPVKSKNWRLILMVEDCSGELTAQDINDQVIDIINSESDELNVHIEEIVERP